MSINDFKPLDPEIEQMVLDKKLEDSLDKLIGLEDGVGKAINDLAHKISKANSELAHFKELQQERERNFIQLVNRNSDTIKKDDLTRLKTQKEKLEARISVQTNASSALTTIAKDYKELVNNMKDLDKTMGKLNKAQSSWRDAAADLSKVKSSQMATGGKLAKIERHIEEGKMRVIKLRGDVAHRETFVFTTLKRISESIIALKNTLKNFSA